MGAWHRGRGTRSALATLAAPDFELPDLAGRWHRLSEHAGRKVLLATWASLVRLPAGLARVAVTLDE